MTRICNVSAPDIMLRLTTSSLLWPGPKSEENLKENIDDEICHLQRPNVVVMVAIESF